MQPFPRISKSLDLSVRTPKHMIAYATLLCIGTNDREGRETRQIYTQHLLGLSIKLGVHLSAYRYFLMQEIFVVLTLGGPNI